jgi:death-on-curing protein
VHVDDVAFLDLADALEAHAYALRLGGGAVGIRDVGRVDAAIMAPQSGYCMTLGEMAATYLHGLAKGHGFVDGNKRTATSVLMMFLGANGYPVVLGEDWDQIVEKVADGSLTKAELLVLIVSRLLGGVDVPIDY